MVHRVANVAPAGVAVAAEAGRAATVAVVAVPAETPSASAGIPAAATAADPAGLPLRHPLPVRLLFLRLDRALEALPLGALPHGIVLLEIPDELLYLGLGNQ